MPATRHPVLVAEICIIILNYNYANDLLYFNILCQHTVGMLNHKKKIRPTVDFVGDNTTWNFWSVLSELLVPAAQVLIGDLSLDVKNLQENTGISSAFCRTPFCVGPLERPYTWELVFGACRVQMVGYMV